MKNFIVIAKFCTILLLPLCMFLFASFRNEKRKLKEVKIHYLGTENVYITDENVREILFDDLNPNLYVDLNQLNINQLEKRLSQNPMVEHSQVYLTIDGILKAKVKQKEPIARVAFAGGFYYIDDKGGKMPLSSVYSARVPLVLGQTKKEVQQELFSLCQYVSKDKFLRENVTQIYVSGSQFSLQMRAVNFTILLGKSEDLHLKFNNFKAFYRKISKDKTLDKYQQVNLKYTNQVICKKNV